MQTNPIIGGTLILDVVDGAVEGSTASVDRRDRIFEVARHRTLPILHPKFASFESAESKYVRLSHIAAVDMGLLAKS